MLNHAAIHDAYFTSALDLSKGPGSALISTLLGEVAGEWLCIVEIERADGQFSLILDAKWAVLSLQSSGLLADDDDSSDGALPRLALLAVIAGWPKDWDKTAKPKMGVHLSDDMIPHVSLSEIGVLTENGQASKTAH